jgi:cell division protein FtsB
MNPNVALMSAVTAVIALILAIFGASWLNQRSTAALLEQMEKRFEANFAGVNQRLDSLEKRIDRIERQLEALFKPILPDRR